MAAFDLLISVNYSGCHSSIVRIYNRGTDFDEFVSTANALLVAWGSEHYELEDIKGFLQSKETCKHWDEDNMLFGLEKAPYQPIS